MLWLLWLLWFAYCVGVVPTWCLVYVGLGGGLRAWAIASGLALVWPPFLWQFKRWQRRPWTEDVESTVTQWASQQS